jgi:peptidoglycan/LPS O-acetylase OafA/YrhL
MLAFVCQDNPQKNKLRRTLLAIAIAGAVVSDIQYFFKMSMFELDKFLWGYCTIFLILGYELSLFIRKFDGRQKKLLAMGIAIYLLGFLIKFGLQNYMFSHYGYVDNKFRWLQSSLCFVTATGMFMTVYALGTWIKQNSIIARIINYIGSCTFAIYLFHMLVLNSTWNFRGMLWRNFHYTMTLPNITAYYIVNSLAVFGITLAIAIVFKYVVEKPVAKLFK